MIKSILNKLQNEIKGLINFCRDLPLVVKILIILAIVILPDPLIILTSTVIKKIKLIVN